MHLASKFQITEPRIHVHRDPRLVRKNDQSPSSYRGPRLKTIRKGGNGVDSREGRGPAGDETTLPIMLHIGLFLRWPVDLPNLKE